MDLVWKRHLKYMLENEVNCDVTIKVGKNQETIKAHKFILNMRSPVFKDMIKSKKDLVIPDITPEVFRELLRFCYNQDSEIKKDIALSLVYAARKYQLPLREHFATRSHDAQLLHLIYMIIRSRIDPDWYTRLKHMLEKEIDCDVAFKVGEDQETIKAHKFILSMQSPVFEKMFNGSFCESEKNPIIPDLCPAAFKALLRYCYYECLVIHSEIALSVLYAAKKYMLPRLEVAARESVIKNLDKSVMLEIAKYATDTGDDALHEGCRSYIVLHIDELNVWDIHKRAADTGDVVLQEISRDYLVRHLDALNVWEMFGHASSTGDDKLYAACRKYIVLTLNSSKIWEVCKYATVTGDEELHTSCKKYLNANLNISNILEVYKYSIDTGDEVLHVHCRSHLMEGLKMSEKTASFVLLVTQLAFSVEDDKLLSCLKAYLKGHPTDMWEIYKYSINNRHQEAQGLCRQYFERDVRVVREALHTEAFLDIPYEVLLDFLHINDKAVHVDEYTEGTQTDTSDYQNCIGISISEIELFKACNAWAEAECRRQKIESTSANKKTVLGECLHLIRFPTMLQKDFLSVVYPTGLHTRVDIAERVDALTGLPVKGQPDVKLSKEANKKQSIEQGFYHQLDSASRERQFLVKPSGDYRPGAVGTMFIESEVRVMLSRIWTSCPGRYKVTVSNERAQTSWSVVLNTKHQNHLSGENYWKQDDILPYLDVTPQVVLAIGTKYSVTTERTECTDFMYRQPGVKYTRIRFDELKVGFSEITVTRDVSTESNVYALTLCLI